MTVLVRLVMLFIAYILACLAASIVLTIGTLTPHWNDLNALAGQSPAVQSAALWSVIAVGTAFIFAIAMLPMVLVIALTEGFALRSIVIYGVIGGALALATAYGLDFFGYVGAPGGEFTREREVLAGAGIAGGLVYWLFAGRNAGTWK